MKVLITGGAGYLGSVMVERMLYLNYRVVVLDNFRHGVASLNHVIENPLLTIVRGDTRLAKTLDLLPSDFDIVIPLAALVGVTECDKDETAAMTTNYGAIVELVSRWPKARFIFPNTNSGYGTSGESICTETSPLKPVSLYGQTKCNAERVIMSRSGSTVFRLATVFGMSPRMRWDLMVNNFVYRAVRERCLVLFQSHYRRNFVHVKDVARAFIWAIEARNKAYDQIFNLGLDSANMTKLELAQEVDKFARCEIVEAPYSKDPDQRDYFVSNDKISKAGFFPQYTIEDGIVELIKGVQQYE